MHAFLFRSQTLCASPLRRAVANPRPFLPLYRVISAPTPASRFFLFTCTPFFSSKSCKMEHGTEFNSSTFSFMDEDHTFGNSVRFTLNQDPRVVLCGYSVPHPSDNKVNIRVQTTGDPAKDVLKDGLQNLLGMCQHVRTSFDKAVTDFKASQPQHMDVDKHKIRP